MSATRIYVISDTRAAPNRHRLVRAVSRAQAIRHVARDWIAADVAGQNTLVSLIGDGVKVEDAAADDDSPCPAGEFVAALESVEVAGAAS